MISSRGLRLIEFTHVYQQFVVAKNVFFVSNFYVFAVPIDKYATMIMMLFLSYFCMLFYFLLR